MFAGAAGSAGQDSRPGVPALPRSATPTAAATPTATVTQPSPTGAHLAGRRTFLLGTLSLGALTGCGVRLEEDAPNIPLVPRREPVAAESLLLTLLTSTAALAVSSTKLGGDLPTILARLHHEQADLLRDVLLHGGVPAGSVDAAIAAATRVPVAADPAALARAEIDSVAEPGELAGAAPDVRPSLLALCAQRHVAAHLLDSDVAAPLIAAAPPAGGSSSTLVAAGTPMATLLSDVRLALARCRFLFQVVAARSKTGQRQRADAVAHDLRADIERIEAMLAEPPPLPLGYPLPLPVATPGQAATLAEKAVADLITALGRALPLATGGPPATASAGFTLMLPRLVDAVLLGHEWKVPLTAFPGLS